MGEADMCDTQIQFGVVLVVRRTWRCPSYSGLSIVETLIVLSVMAVAAVWAVPVLERSATRLRIEAGALEWIAWLERARDETLRTGSVMSLCAGEVVEAADLMGLPLHRTCVQPDLEQACGRAASAPAARDDVAQSDVITWECANLVSMTHDHKPIAVVQSFVSRRGITVLAKRTPVTFVPPLGRIAGQPRSFEIVSNAVYAENGMHDVDAADRAKGPIRTNASRTRLGAHEQVRERDSDLARCVSVAASGRIRVVESACHRY
ncbi:protein of unknown function [Pararobbsia alpina]